MLNTPSQDGAKGTWSPCNGLSKSYLVLHDIERFDYGAAYWLALLPNICRGLLQDFEVHLNNNDDSNDM